MPSLVGPGGHRHLVTVPHGDGGNLPAYWRGLFKGLRRLGSACPTLLLTPPHTPLLCPSHQGTLALILLDTLLASANPPVFSIDHQHPAKWSAQHPPH